MHVRAAFGDGCVCVSPPDNPYGRPRRPCVSLSIYLSEGGGRRRASVHGVAHQPTHSAPIPTTNPTPAPAPTPAPLPLPLPLALWPGAHHPRRDRRHHVDTHDDVARRSHARDHT